MKNDIKEMVKNVVNKLQIKKNYQISVYNSSNGVTCTDIRKLTKNQRDMICQEFDNDKEVKDIYYFTNGIAVVY